MAIINCPECGKEVSDKAVSCPNCGYPIKSDDQEEYLCCPKCYSKELHSEQKGFSGGKALAGAVITGGIGLLAGTIGSKEVMITCLKCGNKFKAGDALVKNDKVLDDELINRIKEKGILQGVLYYKEKTGVDLNVAKKHIEDFVKINNITPAAGNGGCAGILLLFIIVASSMFIFI